MTDFERQIAYNEGCQAYDDSVSVVDNPYEGVSKVLADFWSEGWWDMWYEE